MSTRDRVLEALRTAAGAWVSGQALAEQLGVSRVAVGKHISALVADGYTIEAAHGTGYRLVDTPRLALPAEVRPLLRDPLWVCVEGAEQTASTNEDARTLARQGAHEGTVVVAARQSAGRGRLGRTWESPHGGAYVSAILWPRVAPWEVGPLALVVAIGIARGVASLGATVQLKWPNDVWMGGRKLAGVLLEMSAESDAVEWVVAGFGINVVRDEASVAAAAYLSDVVPSVSPAQAAAAALDGVASAYRQWLAQGFESLATEYGAIATLDGHPVTVRDVGGGIVASGVASGIDAHGRLLIDGDGGIVAVASGDVTLRDA